MGPDLIEHVSLTLSVNLEEALGFEVVVRVRVDLDASEDYNFVNFGELAFVGNATNEGQNVLVQDVGSVADFLLGRTELVLVLPDEVLDNLHLAVDAQGINLGCFVKVFYSIKCPDGCTTGRSFTFLPWAVI